VARALGEPTRRGPTGGPGASHAAGGDRGEARLRGWGNGAGAAPARGTPVRVPVRVPVPVRHRRRGEIGAGQSRVGELVEARS